MWETGQRHSHLIFASRDFVIGGRTSSKHLVPDHYTYSPKVTEK